MAKQLQNNNFGMQQQSKTQQMIVRTNYLKHKQKLNQIKSNSHNNTSLQFYSSSKSKPIDRKRLLMLKMKRQQIQHQNQYLRKKIQKINHSTTNENWRRKIASQHQHRQVSQSVAHNIDHLDKLKDKQAKKIDRYNQPNDKMEVNSDCGDGEDIRCFIPTVKNKIKFVSISQSKASDYNAIIFNLRQKQKAAQNKQGYLNASRQKYKKNNSDSPSEQQVQAEKLPQKSQFNNKKQVSEGRQEQNNSLNVNLNNLTKQRSPSISILQSNPKIKQIIRQSTALTRDDLLYNQPEKQAHRIVLFKKTKIPFPMVSFLIQISLIDNRLLITACGMGLINQDFKYLASRKRTKRILQQIKGKFEILWQRVQVEESGIRLTNFMQSQDEGGVGQGQPDPYEIVQQKQKNLQQKRSQITKDFLQRNYYTLLKQSVNKNKQKQQLALPVTHGPNGKQKYSVQKQKERVGSTQPNSSMQKNRNKSVLRSKIQYMKQKAMNQLNQSKQEEEHQQGSEQKKYNEHKQIVNKGTNGEQKKSTNNENHKNNTNLYQKYRQKQKQKEKEKLKQREKEKPNQVKIERNSNSNISKINKGKQGQNNKSNTQSNNIDNKPSKITNINNKNMNQNLNQNRKTNQKANVNVNVIKNNQSHKKDGQKQQKKQVKKEQKEFEKAYEQQYQDQFQNNSSNLKANKSGNINMNKSKKQQASINQQQMYEQYKNQSLSIQQKYSMEYESNPSKVINNDSSIRAVKKKTINNPDNKDKLKQNKSVGVDQEYEEYIQDLEYQDSFQANKSKSINNKSNLQNNKSMAKNKKNEKSGNNDQEIQQEYVQEFE